ncbi:MAG TPA: MBL fold metallo-hydrolase [Acidimicrobiales bacterium]|nr:MBL fold metallo-hydrolase [Acidimicrobiales bacterium]
MLDSVVRLEPGRLFPSVAAEDWEGRDEHLAPDGRVELFLGGYVIGTGERRVLIDAGVGPDSFSAPSGATVPGGHLVDNLRVAGLHPEDFTDVVLTHLHPDHIGWTSRHGEATFPNATYRCHADDWRWFVEQGEDDIPRQLLAPIATRFEWWDGATTLFPGIDVVPAPGHTPGSSIVVLSSDAGERAMLLGDVVHCPIELVDDEWSCIGDVDPQLARTTRDRLARELEGSDTLVGAAHFPELRFGRLLLGAAGRRWTPVGSSGPDHLTGGR